MLLRGAKGCTLQMQRRAPACQPPECPHPGQLQPFCLLRCCLSADPEKQGARYWHYTMNELGILDISACEDEAEGGWD